MTMQRKADLPATPGGEPAGEPIVSSRTDAITARPEDEGVGHLNRDSKEEAPDSAEAQMTAEDLEAGTRETRRDGMADQAAQDDGTQRPPPT